MSNIRVLLIESDLSDARFVHEALTEMEETTRGGAWIHCNVTHLETLDEAVALLASEPPDIILFSPALEASRGMETFAALRDAAAGVPLIALIEAGEEGLGRRMLREGLQDFVLKCEIDCDPLARTIANAIERQRFLRAMARAAASDPETGLANLVVFQQSAAREAALARECGRTLTLTLAELDNLEELDSACGRNTTHDTIVEAANIVRTAVDETALVGRVGLGRFAVLEWRDTAAPLINDLQQQLQAEHQAFAFVFGHACLTPGSNDSIAAVMAAAEAALCENKLAYSTLP
jgi:PleD family two-component response regulator